MTQDLIARIGADLVGLNQAITEFEESMTQENQFDIETQMIDALLIAGKWYWVRHRGMDDMPSIVVGNGAQLLDFPEEGPPDHHRDPQGGPWLSFTVADEDGADWRMMVPLREVQAIRERP